MGPSRYTALLLGLLAACGGEDPVPACDPAVPAAEGATPPTFTQVRAAAFRGCGFSRCHASGANPAADVVISARDVDAAAVYENLVGAPSSTDVDDRRPPDVPVRVVPSEPASSFLVWKLLGHDPLDRTREVAGERMPQGCSGETCLPCDRIRMVWRWIEAGAKND